MTQPKQPQTSQEQGPKIFLIYFGGKVKNDTKYFGAKETCLVQSGLCMLEMDWPNSGDRLKVIEFSAYQSLQQKVAELEAENKRFREVLDWISKQSITLEDTTSDLEKLCNMMSKKAYLSLKVFKGEEK